MVVLQLALFIITIDFPINTWLEDQFAPVVIFANDQYNVFWVDHRFYPERSIFGARVTPKGVVLDREGKLLFKDRVEKIDAAYDGTNFLVAVQDSC
jgi:hypothetical protein